MQKRNYYIEIEDFLSDESFRTWILSKVDEQGWEEWTLENQQRAKLVEDARLLLLAMKVPYTIISSSELNIALQPNSKLSYLKIFTGNESKVYLSGEAGKRTQYDFC